MKVINFANTTSSPAPKEWEELPEIEEWKLDSSHGETSLQIYTGTNVCQWHYRLDVYWHPYGPIFCVEQ